MDKYYITGFVDYLKKSGFNDSEIEKIAGFWGDMLRRVVGPAAQKAAPLAKQVVKTLSHQEILDDMIRTGGRNLKSALEKNLGQKLMAGKRIADLKIKAKSRPFITRSNMGTADVAPDLFSDVKGAAYKAGFFSKIAEFIRLNRGR